MSRATRSRSFRRAASASISMLLLASGCATGIFRNGPEHSREEAIESCMEKVPAEAVPYADAFAECMEARGWVYRPPAGPREAP